MAPAICWATSRAGHIEGVGFDLYVRMVSEAVEQYKEPERTESVACHHRSADRGVHSRQLHRFRQVAIGSLPQTGLGTYLKTISTSCAMNLPIVTASPPSISRRCSMWRDCDSRRESLAFPRSSVKGVTCACPSSSQVNPCRCAWPESTKASSTGQSPKRM